MRTLLIATLALAAGCGFECTLGEIEGTWRWSYTELDGNCGPIASETVRFSGDSVGGGACVTHSLGTTEDQCRMEMDYECPTADNGGVQRWVIVADQTAPDFIEATGTVQINHTAGSCRSTYDIDIERL